MQLHEKMIFLQNLTQTSNRMLALELQVDPSFISRLRTGRRGIPRNRRYIKAMAAYFAKRCTTEYQRQALSEILDIKQALTVKKDQLTEILYCWLCGESDEVGRFAQTFSTLNLEDLNTRPNVESHNLNAGGAVYYGNEGKRAAAKAFYQHLLSLDSPGTIYLLTDEDDSWILEDYKFAKDTQDWGIDLAHRGFRFCQITPPASSANQAFDSMSRWLPIYMTGQADVYYYPRLRDNFHRRTLIVVPGQIAMTSSSLAGHRYGNATVLTTDQRLTQSYGGEFYDYLSLCRPMLNLHTGTDKLMQCFLRFTAINGTRIQRVSTLSAETAPPEVKAYYLEHLDPADAKKLKHLYLHELDFSDNNDFIDIVHLASAIEIRSGNIPTPLSYGGYTLHYTPELYIIHLKNILHLLKTHDNYHCIPLPANEVNEIILMVKDVQSALLIRKSPSLTVFEISQPDIVSLGREYLLQTAERIGSSQANRMKTISQIKELIRELQS